MPHAKIAVSDLTGLDLNTAKIRMEPGGSQVDFNWDHGRRPGMRVRAGMAKLLDASGTVVNATAAPTRLFAFARDDDEVRVIITAGTSAQAVSAGAASW